MEKKYVLTENEHFALVREVFDAIEYVKIMPRDVAQGRLKIFSTITLNSSNYAYIDFTDYDVHIVLNGLDDSQKEHIPQGIREIIEKEEEYFHEKEQALFQATCNYKFKKFGKPFKTDFRNYIDKLDSLREKIVKKEKEKFAISCKMAELEEQGIALDNEIYELSYQMEQLENNGDTDAFEPENV